MSYFLIEQKQQLTHRLHGMTARKVESTKINIKNWEYIIFHDWISSEIVTLLVNWNVYPISVDKVWIYSVHNLRGLLRKFDIKGVVVSIRNNIKDVMTYELWHFWNNFENRLIKIEVIMVWRCDTLAAMIDWWRQRAHWPYKEIMTNAMNFDE